MSNAVVVLLALGVGVAVGLAVASAVRLRAPQEAAPDRAAQMIDGRLQAQSAEIRRLADAARGQDVADERLAGELRAARQTLDLLRGREEEPRASGAGQAEVGR